MAGEWFQEELMRDIRKRFGIRRNCDQGFSTLELLIVISISLIMAALAIPGFNTIRRTLRINGDGRDLNGALNEAKLQAASGFTRARLYADLGANTFHIETWNKTAGCWQTVNDPANACTVLGTSPVQSLSQGVTFGLGGVVTPPPNTQLAIKQAPACQDTNGGNGTIPNTACTVFNSRGIPVFPGTGTGAAAPYGNDAFYITDNNTVHGLTIGATGFSQVWTITAGSTGGWQHR
jgi:prepilin-type N-terminal cleavage/methylation domain-containing protein